MAYAALLSLMHTLERILHPSLQILSLKVKVTSLLSFLEDFSLTKINHLEGRITDAAFEGEDIIESHLTKQILSRSTSCGVWSCLWEVFCSNRNMNPVFNQHVLELEFPELQKIIDDLDSILSISSIKVEKAGHLELRDSFSNIGSSRSVAINKNVMVGFDEDLIQIKDRLTGSPSDLNIISIVGMGGIGKTTLARNVYEDSLVKYHFDICAWITVSQEYHLQELLSGLLITEEHFKGESHQKTVDQLAENLYKSLKGRRYLIVMDDVWDAKAWDDVKRLFPNDNNGSRIILTTRISEVALYANSLSSIHYMSLLASKESWNLLRDKVFGEERCPPELEKIGKKIAESCKGLPLAIVVIGGLLSKGIRTPDYWEYISENVKSAVTENDNDKVMEILSLSYNYLPRHLKACFLYMGVFPEDYEIFTSQLIKLWVAEGFIKPLTPKSFEEVAEEWLKDLVDRNLIIVRRRNHQGEIKSCGIHDLLRDLCIKHGRNENFLQVISQNFDAVQKNIGNKRRVSIHSDYWNSCSFAMHDSLVRSLFSFDDMDFSSINLSSFRFLKLFDALAVSFYCFPFEVLELPHLRYLAFIYERYIDIPASIAKLQYLQTLIIYGCDLDPSADTLHLPSEIWKLPQLRHLLLERASLPYPCCSIFVWKSSFVLENLYTLSQVRNFRCTEEVFRIIPNLKKLGISYYHDRNTKWSFYEFNNFVYLQKLGTLKCLFISKSVQDRKCLPINFAFPLKLKKLTLSGCRISWQRMSIVGTLPNLEVLKLKDYAFDGPLWEPNEGEFLVLKVLLLHATSLNHWKANELHFPNLQHLSLSFCYELVEVPCDIGNIATLQMIELYECSPLVVESAKLILDEQQNMGNDSLQIRVNSTVDYFNSRNRTSLRKVHTTRSNYADFMR